MKCIKKIVLKVRNNLVVVADRIGIPASTPKPDCLNQEESDKVKQKDFKPAFPLPIPDQEYPC